MSSTTSYNQGEILEIKNFSISYPLPHYKAQNLRDLFIHAVKSPLDFVMRDVDRLLVLDNISLTIKAGERVGFLGTNGSGKTSLCRYVAGLYGESSKIKVHGLAKGIFDTEVAVLPELSGMESAELLAHFLFPELSKKERTQIIQEAAEFSELGHFLDVPFKLYSKGMKARLFLSLVSASPTDLLILDEVFNGADHFFSEKMRARMTDIIHRSKAVIFVSHSLELLTELCTRVVVFHQRQIAYDGPVDAGIHFYKTHCQFLER